MGLRLSEGHQRVLGSPKRSIKFGHWIFFRGWVIFFLWRLWHTDSTLGCYCMAMYLLKFPRQRTHSSHPEITKQYENFNLQFFMSEVVAHRTTFGLLSLHLKTIYAQKMQNLFHWTKIGIVTLFLGHFNAVANEKLFDHDPRNSASIEQ